MNVRFPGEATGGAVGGYPRGGILQDHVRRDVGEGFVDGGEAHLYLEHGVLVEGLHAGFYGDALQLGDFGFLLIAATSSSELVMSSWMPTRPLYRRRRRWVRRRF